LNDLNILNLSPFLNSLQDGSFSDLEKSCTPFSINGKRLNQLYVCVDGIYPKYSRFVRGYKHPVTIGRRNLQSGKKHAEKILNVLLEFFKAGGNACRDLFIN
jgi:hypothetical protein